MSDAGPDQGLLMLASTLDDGGVTRLVLHQPTLTTALLVELGQWLAAAPPRPLVVCSRHPRIFLAGAHLGDIARLEATTSLDYAEQGRGVMSRLASFPAPVVAAVAGSCAGGGFDLALACDAIVATATATFAHPGVVRGLVTGWGGTLALRRRALPVVAGRLLLEGRPVPAAVLTTTGIVQVTEDDPTRAATVEARRLAALAPARLQLWRALRRGRFVDSFRAFVVHNG